MDGWEGKGREARRAGKRRKRYVTPLSLCFLDEVATLVLRDMIVHIFKRML